MRRILLVFILGCSLMAGCQPYSYKEKGVPVSVALTPRLAVLFAKTKTICFGRYALEVPEEAELLWGPHEVPSRIEVHPGEAGNMQIVAEAFRARVLAKDSTAELTYFGPGPSRNSVQIRWFADRLAKRVGAASGYTFVAAGNHLFEWRGISKIKTLIPVLRARDNNEIPRVPGICIDLGFIPDDTGAMQEIVSAGIQLPSFPDVSFSISSNKTASIDDERGLLASIARQRSFVGDLYPKLTTLREGKRNVGIWKGEESLVRRADGAHDFEWEVVGQERNTLHPAVFGVRMYTQVDADRIGAADHASLSDDEAVALWDKLLDSLRFRVNAAPTVTDPPPTAHSRDVCPRTGRWRATVPAGHRDETFVKSGPAVHVERGMQLPRYGLDDAADEAQVVWVWQGDY